MPLYNYSCQKCACEFEALVFAGDEVECPQCQSRELQQHWGIPARTANRAASLPVACDPNLPPCGPTCCKLPR
jgi:putative FmdB family regulatory protein